MISAILAGGGSLALRNAEARGQGASEKKGEWKSEAHGKLAESPNCRTTSGGKGEEG